MKHSVYKVLFTMFEVVKIIASVLLLIFPQKLMGIMYPFSVIAPLLLSAIAYAGISKYFLYFLLIIFIGFVLGLILFNVMLFRNQQSITLNVLAIVLQVFFCCEALCFLLSLMFGSVSFGKVIGIIFNLVMVITLKKIRTRDSSPP